MYQVCFWRERERAQEISSGIGRGFSFLEPRSKVPIPPEFPTSPQRKSTDIIFKSYDSY